MYDKLNCTFTLCRFKLHFLYQKKDLNYTFINVTIKISSYFDKLCAKDLSLINK